MFLTNLTAVEYIQNFIKRLNLYTLREKISSIKGIGESRLDEIIDIICREINEE